MSQVPPTRSVGRLALALRLTEVPPPGQPVLPRIIVASVAALFGSLLADVLLVGLGTRIFPATIGYTHFRPSDYGLLTVVGVGAACMGWPVVTRVSFAPRWLYLRLAIVTTLVLWLPDIWLLAHHQPRRAVAVLMAMHLVLAIVTYNAMVRLAPMQLPSGALQVPDDLSSLVPDDLSSLERRPLESSAQRRSGVVMLVGVGLEFLLGVATLVLVPPSRPNGVVPVRASVLYVTHAVTGGVLFTAALWLVLLNEHSTNVRRMSSRGGAFGLAVAGLGGMLCTNHSYRLGGIGLMLLGSLFAGFSYLVPAVDMLTGGPPENGAARSHHPR